MACLWTSGEKDVLSFVLGGCPEDGPIPPSDPLKLSFGSSPTEQAISAPASTPAEPDQAISTPVSTSDESDQECHPAYSPCLPNLSGDALNCGDLAANQKPVRILQSGVDPYRLDGDGDGSGCESGTTAESPTAIPTANPTPVAAEPTRHWHCERIINDGSRCDRRYKPGRCWHSHVAGSNHRWNSDTLSC